MEILYKDAAYEFISFQIRNEIMHSSNIITSRHNVLNNKHKNNYSKLYLHKRAKGL